MGTLLRLLALAGWLLAAFAAQAAERTHRVLILHSYHPGFSWTSNIHTALLQRLRAAEPGMDIRAEHLDWKNYPRREMLDLVQAQLEAKYAGVALDLVITSDNAAAEFALARREKLFPGVPVVFCGVNGYRPGLFGVQEGVTGVSERLDPVGTLAIALRLHPGLQRVVAVCDRTESGMAIRGELELGRSRLPQSLELVFVGGEPTEDLVRRLSQEPPTTLLFVCLFTNDGAGRSLDLWELPRRLREAGARAPVWGLYEEAMGHGIVGGNLQSGQRQGSMAAELALRILGGAAPGQLAVMDVPTVGLVFDHRELHRFGVSEAQLPSGSEVRFAPDSFYMRHRRLILGSLAGSLALALALAALLAWRMASERHLRRSEARLQGLIQHMPLLTCAFDGKGRVLLWNQACARLTGATPEALAERSEVLEDLMPESAARAHFLEAARGEREGGFELPLRGWDGRTRTVHWFSQAKTYPIPGWAGWMVGVDVTAQREAEAARDRLVHAIGQSLDGILLVDGEGRVTYANPAVDPILGLAGSGAAGRDLLSLFQAGEPSGAVEAALKAARNGRPWRGQIPLQGPDGGRRTVSCVFSPVLEGGQILGVAAVLRDATEQLALQEQLARAQRMESLGALAGGIAHDFRNLMGAVLGGVDLLQEEAELPEGHPQILRMEQIRQAARRGVEVVEQLLGFARSRPNRMERVRVADLFKELGGLLGHALPAGIRIEWAEGPEGLVVQGDGGQLLQVMLNLALNARDAMPEGGTLRIAASEAGDQVCLSVQDTGMGMAPEVQARIFEPMFSTKAPGVGTGMGLAMVYRLVRSHGGTVTVESQPGAGSTFRVLLPPAPPTRDSASP